MTTPDDPEFVHQLGEASARVEALHAELLAAYPALRGNLSIPGMLVGHGLGSFVANGMPDDQIVARVLAIAAQIRQTLGKLRSAPDARPDSQDDAATCTK